MHIHGFRAKSPERVLSEIKEVLNRYGVHHVELVDNVLDRAFFKTLFPRMAGLKPRPILFGEIRSTIKRHEVKLLKLAGFQCLQPGVEALDDDLLKLLNKGILAMHNIQLLKWCEEEEIILYYNHLLGIPGETKENYEKVLANMGLVPHLTPPFPNMLYLDRFSEYYRHPEQYGIQIKGPIPVSHPYCFPEPGADVEGLSYHFRHGFLTPGAENHKCWGQVVEEIKRWHLDYESGKGLWGRRENGGVVIEDTRFQEEPMIFFLTSRVRECLERLERHEVEISLLAKTETLTESLETYRQKVGARKRNPAAAYQLALASGREYRAGDQISYCVTGTGKNVKVYENCRLTSEYDPMHPDENVSYYQAKLVDLVEKFEEFLA